MERTWFIFVLVLWISCSAAAQDGQEKSFQFSLLTPVGTNGADSHRVTNRISFNLIGGYSRANTLMELGGMYNINLERTRGFQLAGLFNYTGKSENAVHWAGAVNIVRTGSSPFQLAGIANVGGDVNGLQLAGMVNVAKKVRGVQVGLINYAEESDGVSLGLINIVRHGGKYEWEIAFSEVLHTAVHFRLGTDRLYTIFSGGVHYDEKQAEIAAGLGLGTHINWKKGWGNQIELIGYGLTHDGSFRTEGVNMLVQCRLPVSWKIKKHFKIFAGPVLNISVVDSSILVGNRASWAPWTLWEHTDDTKRQCGWLGFVAGMRF